MKRILLVGKPNCGKSLLFNQLTGLKQKVANFPGVTVELKSGQFNEFERCSVIDANNILDIIGNLK